MYYNYKESIEIEKQDYGFYSIIMAAMRKADSINIELLKTAFPDIYTEFKARYHAVGGFLSDQERNANFSEEEESYMSHTEEDEKYTNGYENW